MPLKIAEWSNMSARDILGVVLAAGAAGAGTRLLRNAYDLTTGRDVNPPAPLPQVTPAVASVPTKVTPEEAAELERQGVHVKHRPAPASPKPVGAIPAPMGDEPLPAYAPHGAAKTAGTFLDNLALSVAGTGAAYGGWKLLDNHFDEQRRAAAQKKLDAVRGRITNLLNNTPAPIDVPLHAQMKAAEDLYFKGAECTFPGGPNGCPKCGKEFDSKEHTCEPKASLPKVAWNPVGSLMSGAASGVLNLAAPWAIPIGIGGTALGLAAYNESKKQNKYQQASKAIRQYYDSRRVTPPQAEIEPYVEDAPDAALTPPVGGHKAAALNEILRKRMAA